MTSNELADFIRKNTRVILPNFGAFLQKHDPSGIFNPLNITFSPFLRYDDGALAAQLARQKNISIDSANQEIAQITDEIARSIANHHKYAIPGLGQLLMDENRNIQFKVNQEVSEQETDNTEADNQSAPQAGKPDESTRQQTQSQQTQNNTKTEQSEQTTNRTWTTANSQQHTNQNNTSTNNTNNSNNQEPNRWKKAMNNRREKKQAEKTTGTDETKNQNKSQQHTDTEEYINNEPIGLKTVPLKKRLAIGGIFVAISIVIIIGLAFLIRSWVYPKQLRTPKPEKILVESSDTKMLTEPQAQPQNSTPDNLDKAFEAMNPDAEPTTSTNQSPTSDANATNTSTTSTETSDATSTETSDEQTEQTPQPEQPANSYNNYNAPTQTSTNPAGETKFYLIVGSFQEKANAENLSNTLRESNLNAIIVTRQNGSYAVSIDSYNTRDEAKAAQARYAEQFPAAWITSAQQ